MASRLDKMMRVYTEKDENHIKVIDELVDALISMLNLEGPARVGAREGAFKGLDVSWHVRKARAAITNAKDCLTLGSMTDV
jgi:hypothetical protein